MPATLPWNTNQLVPVEAMVAGKRKVEEEEDEEEMQHSNKRQCQWTGLQGQGDHAPAPAQFQQHFNLLQQHPQHLRQLEQNQQQQQQDVEDSDMMDTADTTDNNSMLPQYKQHPTKMMFQQVQSQHTEPRCPSPWPNQPAAMPIHPPQPMPVIPPQQMPVIPPQQMPQPQQPQQPQLQHQEPATDLVIGANIALRKMRALKDCPERGCGEMLINAQRKMKKNSGRSVLERSVP